MSYWSVYVSAADERALKKKIQQIAKKNRWSFSQAVSGILRDYFHKKQPPLSEDEAWDRMAARSFFEGYSEKDSIYDDL